MAFSGILFSAGDATSNPNPNALGVVSPYPTPYVNRYTVSTGWTGQGTKALIPVNAVKGQGQVKIPIAFVTSVANATYTATVWTYIKEANVWVQPKDNASFTISGNCYTYIETPDEQPIAIQLSSISSGTVTCYFDSGLARAL